MDGMKRSYALPPTLREAFDREARRYGLCLTQTVAAVIVHFLHMSPADQAACLRRLIDHVPPETYQRAPSQRRSGPPAKRRRPPQPPNVVTGKILRLQITPHKEQCTIG